MAQLDFQDRLPGGEEGHRPAFYHTFPLKYLDSQLNHINFEQKIFPNLSGEYIAFPSLLE